MATAADVPGKFDCVINGTGYLFLDSIEESLPFRVSKAIYSYSPTFVERQNTQGNYGDDQQAFWLTASQNDWSQGEDQRFFRANDADASRRYYQGTAVDVRIEGQASLRGAVKSITTAAAPQAAVGTNAGMWYATSTNLYLLDSAGTITDKGVHGLGVAPSSPNGIASDGVNIFLSSSSGGTVGVRRYSGSAFSTFSATGSDALAFLNNSLYGFGISGTLRRYDTAGVATTLSTFTTATGGSTGDTNFNKLLPFGGKLLLFRGYQGNGTSEGRGELWIYDGVGTSRVASFEPNFYANDAAVSNGIVFVVGTLQAASGSETTAAVMYYANGNTGLLWKSIQGSAATGGISTHDGGIVWGDQASGQYVYYDLANGSFHRIGAYGAAAACFIASNTYNFFSFISNSTATDLYPDTSKVSAATVTSSLFDFDSSLTKLFRGIVVNFDSATTGNGGSVDIAYRVGDVGGSYTTLQTGATSGTEYTLSGVTGRSISVKVTLNKGTSTLGPVLKRIYVRAAPVLQQYPHRTYVIAAFGDPAGQGQLLRDGVSTNPKSGRDMANDLITAVSSTTPITITDRFGTYTAILEPADFELREIHANPLVPTTKSGSFIARVTARGV